MPKSFRDNLTPQALKWSSNGELSAIDLARVLERIQSADNEASAIGECSLSCGINDQRPA